MTTKSVIDARNSRRRPGIASINVGTGSKVINPNLATSRQAKNLTKGNTPKKSKNQNYNPTQTAPNDKTLGTPTPTADSVNT
jgi:hypothetical protein